eukprot:CAMPEP_0177786302 /NCGR_PEP_ID=MMETSP0491_2-20121128/20844_1 /TAXON_ID=63592 /ORGANISM="Tetraselmis chuii, Strain PLY429" /LENGTH=101 /DNA_ID=CAMNT_0019307491 /DNA_START=157 /DNA_END=462 /DNA_ORIENTATION=+
MTRVENTWKEGAPQVDGSCLRLSFLILGWAIARIVDLSNIGGKHSAHQMGVPPFLRPSDSSRSLNRDESATWLFSFGSAGRCAPPAASGGDALAAFPGTRP